MIVIARFHRLTLALVLTALITLSGCQGLVPRDTSSLCATIPAIRDSGLCGRFWHHLRGASGLDRNAQASFKRGYESAHGGYHGDFSDYLGLLRPPDLVATSHRLELNRGAHEFS